MRAPRRINLQRHRHRLENFGDPVGQRGGKGRRGHLAVESVLADTFGKTGRDLCAKVGSDQRVLDLFKRGGVDGRASEKRGQRGGDLRACLAQSGGEFLQPAHATFLVAVSTVPSRPVTVTSTSDPGSRKSPSSFIFA